MEQLKGKSPRGCIFMWREGGHHYHIVVIITENFYQRKQTSDVR